MQLVPSILRDSMKNRAGRDALEFHHFSLDRNTGCKHKTWWCWGRPDTEAEVRVISRASDRVEDDHRGVRFGSLHERLGAATTSRPRICVFGKAKVRQFLASHT